MLAKKQYRKFTEIVMDDVDRTALGGKHIGWNERSGPYFYEKGRKILLHRWVFDRMLQEEMVQNGWDEPRFPLVEYNVSFQNGDKKNCRRDNLYCDYDLVVDPLPEPEEEIDSGTHRLLPCIHAPRPILVRIEDYKALKYKHLMWNRGRGAFFYEDGKRIYVHRNVFERMCQEELWFAELQFLPNSTVGFIDGDMTSCDRDNLFLWSCNSPDRKIRRHAKEEARLLGIEWHRQRYELLEKWRQEDAKRAENDGV